MKRPRRLLAAIILSGMLPATALLAGQIAIRGKAIYTMAAAGKIDDGIMLIDRGKITAIGRAADVKVPDGWKTLSAAVITPGLIDAHSTVGLSGIFNQKHDSDQLERSSPIQPELRALDAYNPQERLVEYVRSFGITTLHTGHAPGELISGQTLLVKTAGNSVEAALLREPAAIAATISPWATKSDNKSPGTRGKLMAMLRAELIKTREYVEKRSASPPSDAATAASQPARELHRDALARVLGGEVPLMVTANRAQDIASVLRLAEEFKIKVWIDSAAEAYLLTDAIKKAGVPVILHPSMFRAYDETENLSFETAANLIKAGVPIALQSGYESYVPKTRIVLFEAAIAAANGLTFEQALATITSDAAKILGIADRVGTLEVGKDGDVALYDGDPFEYTTHCVGTVIDGVLRFEGTR